MARVPEAAPGATDDGGRVRATSVVAPVSVHSWKRSVRARAVAGSGLALISFSSMLASSSGNAARSGIVSLVADHRRGPRVDPRHLAVAALVFAQSSTLDADVREDLGSQARGLLDGLDLLGGRWLPRAPYVATRSVRDAAALRDRVEADLRERDDLVADERRWLGVAALRGEGERALPFDLRVLACVVETVRARDPRAFGDDVPALLERAADAVEEHTRWTEPAAMQAVRSHVRRASGRLLRGVVEIGPPGVALALARWSRTRGALLEPQLVHANARPVEVRLDVVGGARPWEGFTDGGPASGLFLPSWSPWKVGDRIELCVGVGTSPPRAALGVVRWVRESAQSLEPGIGVELVDTCPDLDAELRRLARQRGPLRVF